MTLIRWDPFTAADDTFARFPGSLGRWARALGTAPSADWSPSVDISETPEEYVLRAELPAVRKEDVSVMVENGMLTLSGERRQREVQKDEKFHRLESFYGNFTRSFALPQSTDPSTIRAESKDGIVTIHVPKAKTELKKSTTIKVQ